jgi:outer membrane protein assembly factor BamE (lipoprotein component of BamABCDE complex)
MFCRTVILISLLTLALTMQGCLYIPPVKISSDEAIPFDDVPLNALQAGVSFKDDVRAKLGAPSIEFGSGSVWVYEDVFHEDWFYIFVMGSLYGGGEVAGGRYEKDIPYFLVIRFDEAGNLASNKLIQLGDDYYDFKKATRCKEGLCASWLATRDQDGTQIHEYRGIYSVFAADPVDAWTKQFQVPADRCGVYVYWNQSYPLESWLDGQPAGWLLNQKQFIFWQLNPGTHHLFVRAVRPWSQQILDSAQFKKQSIHLDCEAGSLYFFEPTVQRSGNFAGAVLLSMKRVRFWMELEQRDAAQGKVAIAKRQLVLSTWDNSRRPRPIILTPEMELRVVEPGVTTREDVIARLGLPDIESDKYGLMAYINAGPEWFNMIGAENGMQMLGQQYVLFIKFDSNGKATDYELHSINSILNSSIAYTTSEEAAKDYEHIDMSINCTADGHCLAAGGLIVRYATAIEDKNARGKSARAGKNECVISVFSDKENRVWRVSLDAKFAAYINDALWPKAFLQWRLPAGEYSITAEIVDTVPQAVTENSESTNLFQSVTDKVTCRGSKEYYIVLTLHGNEPLLALKEFVLVKKEIQRRNLILSEN